MNRTRIFGGPAVGASICISLLLAVGCVKEQAGVQVKGPSVDLPVGVKDGGKANLQQPADPLADAKERSKANLTKIAKAFDKFQDAHGHFPIGIIDPKYGLLGLSWRVQILPYLDDSDAVKVFKQFRLAEPWDSEHNKKLLAGMPKVYAPVRGQTDEGGTFYQGFADRFLDPKGNEWPNEVGAIPPGIAGAFFLDSRVQTIPRAEEKPTVDGGLAVRERRRDRIADGTMHTFLVAEAGVAVPWTKPQDIPYRRGLDNPLKGTCPKLGGLFGGDFHVVMVSGTIYQIKKDVPAENLRPFITFQGGEDLDYFSLGVEPPDWADVKPFVGTWLRVSFEENGKKQPFDESKKFTLKFTKDNKVVYSENEIVLLKGRFYVFDKDKETPNQARWDWNIKAEDRVIYLFEDENKLVTCWTREEGAPWPTRLATNAPKGGTYLATWKRVTK